MTIRRRESKDGPRFDVEWRLPDRTKRSKTFKSEREARVFEASLVTKFAAGDIVDPRAGRITLVDGLPVVALVATRPQPEGAARI